MALRIRVPFLLDFAIVRDDAEMTRLNNDPTIVRQVSGKGGLIHRLMRQRMESMRVDATRRLPALERRDDPARAAAQAATDQALTALAAGPPPFDRQSIAALARFVAGARPVEPVGVTVQRVIGRLFDPTYVATEASYAAARDVAAVFSACPVTALRVLLWSLTGRLRRSKDLVWRLAAADPIRIHATAIAMHQVVTSLARMRKAFRTDVWDTTPAEAVAYALAAPRRLLRECTAALPGRDRLRDGTLVMFTLRTMHRDTASNDLAFSRQEWSQCPAHAIVPRLLDDVWTTAVRERAAQRRRPRRSLVRRLSVGPVAAAFRWINRWRPWYELPWPLAFLNLATLRLALRERTVHDTSLLPSRGTTTVPPTTPDVLRWRTADGSYNDLDDPTMGRAGTRFGRNVPLGFGYPDEARLLTPSPREVSRRLLARKTFIPQDGLNALAAAWIQFQVHDWFLHADPDLSRPIEITVAEDDPWPRAQRPMRVGRTRADHTRGDDSPIGPPTYLNTVTHWWDASQLYGSDQATQDRIRSHVDGKLALDHDGRLPRENGIEVTGVSANWWLGLSLFHQLFTLEHNAICDRLKAEYPAWGDEPLFQTARLVNAALMTKIHDLEWAPRLLANKAVQKGLYVSWWGILGKWVATHVGRVLPTLDLVSGIPGSATDHHAAPYAITEEFVSVYRMHAFMLPDSFEIRSAADGRSLYRLDLKDTLGAAAGDLVKKYGVPDLLYSFGRTTPGKLTLGNYPTVLRQFQPQAGGPVIDLATVDILRDRERGVPRYNAFRRLLDLPPIRTFEELNERWAPDLREIYDSVEDIDLMVGLFAETPPPGCGISDTTFRIFLLMNGRRLKSDRFYTIDYTPAVYTQAGLDWVADNDLRRVLLRHYPMLEPALRGVDDVFGPWSHPAQAVSPGTPPAA